MVREKLAPALSSIARWSISNPMEWKSLFWHFFPSPSGLSQTRWTGKKLLFQDSSIAEGCFSAPMVKQGKWIPSTKKFSQRRWSERPGSSLERRGFPSWQKFSKRRWCLQPKVAGNHSIGFEIDHRAMEESAGASFSRTIGFGKRLHAMEESGGTSFQTIGFGIGFWAMEESAGTSFQTIGFGIGFWVMEKVSEQVFRPSGLGKATSRWKKLRNKHFRPSGLG